MKKYLLAGLAMTALAAQSATAGTIGWTDWTAATNGANGSATGHIGSIDVSYTGDVTFAQLGTGTNFWTQGNPAPYTGNAVVDNAPTASEMIAMSRAGITNTVLFSQAVTDPIMAIVSQGQYGLPVTYDFNSPFSVLSEGRGYWGDGRYELQAGDKLKGYELHAVIQFDGTFNSISWTSAPGEYWHGFTFGLPAQNVPAPAGLGLIALGLLGMAGFRRKA